MISPMANTSRITPTAIGRIGTSRPRSPLTGGRGPPLPVPERTGPFVLVAITYGRIPTYPFWPRPGHSATDRLGPEPIGRRSPLREYEGLYIVRADTAA